MFTAFSISSLLVNSFPAPGIKPVTWFYFTHRAEDLTGAVSRVNKAGQLELVFKGIIESRAEHQINDIKMGPDGWMYVAFEPAGNVGVMGPSVAIIMKSLTTILEISQW